VHGSNPCTHYRPGMSKRTSYGKIYRPDVRARPRLPRGRVFTRKQVFTVRDDGKKHVRTDASTYPRR
jgi:hypothetical protein